MYVPYSPDVCWSRREGLQVSRNVRRISEVYGGRQNRSGHNSKTSHLQIIEALNDSSPIQSLPFLLLRREMQHVHLDRAFKCARLDASYTCLKCRLKAISSIPQPGARLDLRQSFKDSEIPNPRLAKHDIEAFSRADPTPPSEHTSRPRHEHRTFSKVRATQPGKFRKIGSESPVVKVTSGRRAIRGDQTVESKEKNTSNQVNLSRRSFVSKSDIFRKYEAGLGSEMFEERQAQVLSEPHDPVRIRGIVLAEPSREAAGLITFEAGRGVASESLLRRGIKQEEYIRNDRTASRQFRKHARDLGDLRVQTDSFNANNLQSYQSTPAGVRVTEQEEAAVTADFLEALAAHTAALEDSREGLRPWEHLDADGELDEVSSLSRPFSEHLNDMFNGGLAGEEKTQRQAPSGIETHDHSTASLLENVSHASHSSSTISPQRSIYENKRSPRQSSIYSPFPGYAGLGNVSLDQSRPRLFHTSARRHQQAAAATVQSDDHVVEFPATRTRPNKYSDIRQQLRQWQDDHGDPKEDTKPQPVFDADNIDPDDMMNSMTRLPDMNTAIQQSAAQDEEERSANSHMPTTDSRDGIASENADTADTTFLNTGDLVELEYTSSERNSVLAVFVRRIPGSDAQFFTMQGRWVFMKEKKIMWSLPGWASKSDLAALMEYLPNPQTAIELEEMLERAQVEDLSVPRSASGPLVKRLVGFWTETQSIYRKHASVLDNAHNLLAHESDLRYGSLVSASSTLLQIPANELPVAALYAVRTALGRAPLAFSTDRRSHRMTGYLQIRSKESVRMIQHVRDWMRDWQDDVAAKSHDGRIRKHTRRGAQYIYSFLEKARKIVLNSREDRDVLPLRIGNIGISKKRFPISEDSQAVRITQDMQFTEQDMEIVRFIEAWCASGTLRDVVAYAALPPMLLQATGLYEQFEQLEPGTGFTFLQELGVLLPYENRVRFDSHLLLPSSQHSKPLQNLMDNLIKMQHNHDFRDSMQSLRRDWGSLPVFCVDDAGAQEIDDGVSIEPVDGKDDEYWLHAHVANPTAFFERDHSLAKMARHMGESIYMPERAYMMLPRWATSQHFSLAKDRPCITFSTRVNLNADILERRVTPGIVHNVISLTPSDVTSLLGEKDPQKEKTVLTVGGGPPPQTVKKSMIDDVSEEMKQSLHAMRTLTDKLSGKRLGRGGIFFDNAENDISVWQNSKGQGLAWDHPWRRGSRTVEGDPVLQLKTPGLVNWFAPKVSAGGGLIREMMLLAGETAATWCSDRGIPTIFRGTVRRPDVADADAFYREVVAPAVEEHGEIPLYIGVRYFSMQGATSLRTTPFPHKVAGLEQYAKTTSPLRRYGDMIAHWQIEAALREEARLGRSLRPDDTARDASFLPFSSNVLQTIMLGLSPREHLITRAKAYSRDFWIAMLLFRAYHFGECELPFAGTHVDHLVTGKPMLQIFLQAIPTGTMYTMGMATQLNVAVQMSHPVRAGLDEPKRGDTWEVEIEHIDVYRRIIISKPLRLVDRPVDERLERWKSVTP